MANLFSKAKATAQTKATNPKDQKTRVTVDADFFDKVEMLETLQDRMKRDEAKANMLKDEIKDIAKTEWINLYERTGRNPGSIVVEAQRGLDVAQTMFVPSDKYTTINADRAEALVEKFGDAIVEEKTVFSFNNEMIEKYGEILSRMIEESSEISEADKSRIIQATSTFSIAKGTIDRFNQFGAVDQLFDECKPVISLKNVEVVKG